jgi:hypothetical protein
LNNKGQSGKSERIILEDLGKTTPSCSILLQWGVTVASYRSGVREVFPKTFTIVDHPHDGQRNKKLILKNGFIGEAFIKI